jgi:hypothetical protein
MKTWDEGVAEHWLTEGQLFEDPIMTDCHRAFFKASVRKGPMVQKQLDFVLDWANKQRAARGLPPVDGKAER